MKPETLVARIQSYSSSEESLQQLLAVLSKHECVVNQHCQTLLDNIDPNLHSLGYLYILWSWSYNFLNPNGDPYFVKKASVFLIECCKMQVSMVPAKFCSVCRTFKDQVMALQTPSRGIVPLRHAVDKLLPSAEYLSPVHVDFILVRTKMRDSFVWGKFWAVMPFLLALESFIEIRCGIHAAVPDYQTLRCCRRLTGS